MKTSRTRSHIVYLALPVIFLVLYHGRILFWGEILCGGDLISQFVPWREFALNELAQGRFPVWNPYVFCGAPFAANIQTSLFYPENIFHLLFSVERTFTLSFVLHHLLAFVSMYFFLFRLWNHRGGAVLGAVAYAWSGFLIAHGYDGHLIHIRAYALLPLALYFQTRMREEWNGRFVFFFALSLAGMFYAGHTQIPLYAFYLLFFRALWWGVFDYQVTRRFVSSFQISAWTLGGLALAVGLGALVLAPLLQLSQHTASRAGGANYSFATSDSMPPAHAITLLAPFFYGNPTSPVREEQFWETRTGYHEICGYVGILPLLLFWMAFLPRAGEKELDKTRFARLETVFFSMVTLVGLLFALGSYTPFYALLYYGLPGWSYFRVPGRLLLFFILGTSVLSARGLVIWLENDLSAILNRWPCKIAVLSSVVFGVATGILFGSRPAALQMLREFEIDRTIAEFNLWLTNRADISRQLPEFLFEKRYAVMLVSMAIACGWLLLSWASLFAAKRVGKHWVWLIPFCVLSVDLFYFSTAFVHTLPANEWRSTYFPDSELVQFLQKNLDGARVLCLDDAIGFPVIDVHPELRPNRLMHYGIRTVRGYDPIILRSYTRFVNRIFGQKPDTPQGGLLFFSAVPGKQYLDRMNVKFVLTTQALSSPYVPVWHDAKSGLSVYENPGIPQPAMFLDEQTGSEMQIQDQAPGRLHLHVKSNGPNRLLISQNEYPGWVMQSSDSAGKVDFLDSFPVFSLPAGETDLSLRMLSFSIWPFSVWMLGLCLTGLSLGAGCVLFWRSKS